MKHLKEDTEKKSSDLSIFIILILSGILFILASIFTYSYMFAESFDYRGIIFMISIFPYLIVGIGIMLSRNDIGKAVLCVGCVASDIPRLINVVMNWSIEIIRTQLIVTIIWILVFLGLAIISGLCISKSGKTYIQKIWFIPGALAVIGCIWSTALAKGIIESIIAYIFFAFAIILAGLGLYKTTNKERQSSTKRVQAATQQDSINELKKYKVLLDEGVITEDEFNVKKNQLLRG